MSAPTFTETWGCQMIAYMFNAVLYGMSLILVFQYFRQFGERDSRVTKGTVFSLGVLSTAQYGFLSHQIYTDYVTRFGREDLLNEITFSANVMLFAIYLTAFTAQMFFASRIWLISSSRGGRLSLLLTTPVVVLAFLQIGAGLAQTIIVSRLGKYNLLETTTKVTSTQAAATAACDIAITTILCQILHTSRSGVKRTDTMIDKLIVYAINRGAATSICALLNLILFVCFPGTFIFMIWIVPSSHLYVISVCSMLLSRNGLQGPNLSSQWGHDLSEISRVQTPVIHVQRSIVTWEEGKIVRGDISPNNSTLEAMKYQS